VPASPVESKAMSAYQEELERVVLEKLIANGPKGVTRFDFPEYPFLTEELLERVIASIEQLLHMEGGGVMQ
jgi:3-phosphoglycerate kinase